MIRVLFVDADSDALAQLRQLLRGFRDRWSMRFVTTGPDALDALTIESIDVVVVDSRMPGVDGPSLLDEIREAHPGSVRMVIADTTQLTPSLRRLPAAHQFLAKPCDPAKLEAAIDRSLLLRDRFTSPELLDLIVGMDNLPSPSATVVALQAALSERPIDPDRVARLIRTDVAISTKILQVANSAFFGLPRTMTDPIEAVNYLGAQAICELVISTEVFRSVGSRSKARDAQIAQVQQRGMARADIACSLALRARRSAMTAREIWVGAFLSEVGALLLLGVERPAVPPAADGGPSPDPYAPLVPTIGAYLLSMWGLPHYLVETVALSCDAPTSHGSDPAGFAWIADHVLGGDDEIATVDPGELDLLGLRADDLSAVANRMETAAR
jgi:HD-like signal output (HDOD) protein/ActR/RegA family two-component response regulator